MSEGSASHGESRSRPALGDVTNRLGKRGFSGIEKDGVMSFNFSDKDAVKRFCVSPRPCSEINSLKGNVISSLSKIPKENREPNLCDDDGDGLNCLKEKSDVNGNLKLHNGREKDKILDLDCLKEKNDVSVNDLGDGCGEAELFQNVLQRVDEVAGQNQVDPNLADIIDLGKFWNSIANEDNGCSTLDSLKENRITGKAEEANETRCPSLDFGVCDAIHSVNAEANSELGDGSRADTSRTVSETGNDYLRDEETCEENISPEGTQSEFIDRHNDLDDHNADNFVLSQTGSVDCTLPPQSQESRVFGIDKSNGCAQMTVGTNAIKSCSCSFCTKAAYIWLDLHQKDIKARTSALKKSQRDASILAERSCRIKVNEKHGAESATRANKLESHLVHQWKSLFQHMADIWEAESNQLDASLLPLNNLKDRCKAEMELMNAKPSEKN